MSTAQSGLRTEAIWGCASEGLAVLARVLAPQRWTPNPRSRQKTGEYQPPDAPAISLHRAIHHTSYYLRRIESTSRLFKIISFYKQMGAHMLSEWRIMRIDGEALKALAASNPE